MHIGGEIYHELKIKKKRILFNIGFILTHGYGRAINFAVFFDVKIELIGVNGDYTRHIYG
jgi:hypothetical protein